MTIHWGVREQLWRYTEDKSDLGHEVIEIDAPRIASKYTATKRYIVTS